MTNSKRVDWNVLCNHPMVIFFQRVVLMLGVPAAVAVAVAFVDMRNTMISTTNVLARMEKRLDDHEQRMRAVESVVNRYGPATPREEIR